MLLCVSLLLLSNMDASGPLSLDLSYQTNSLLLCPLPSECHPLWDTQVRNQSHFPPYCHSCGLRPPAQKHKQSLSPPCLPRGYGHCHSPSSFPSSAPPLSQDNKLHYKMPDAPDPAGSPGQHGKDQEGEGGRQRVPGPTAAPGQEQESCVCSRTGGHIKHDTAQPFCEGQSR